MKNSNNTPAMTFAAGMGEAVALRTICRKIARPVPLYHKTITLPRRDDMALDIEVANWCKSNNLVTDGYDVTSGDGEEVDVVLNIVSEVEVEKWEDVAHRVAVGNSLLEPRSDDQAGEYNAMHHHLRQASILMSGRHLQHGDETQPTRNMEVFTNCSTSASSFLEFYLLLNGSGVGRSYDNAMQIVDFANLPIVVCAIDSMHKDAQSGEIVVMDRRNAEHLYAGRTIVVFEVPDSREGWAKAVEKMELMAYQGIHRDSVLLLDFSLVRPRNSPIAGMQNRPASGPGPLMTAITKVAAMRDAGMAPWRAAIYADHYFAECVLVGGARRAARMATKTWYDENVLDFIAVKRGGFLWSSNNSVTVDKRFWDLVKTPAEEMWGIPLSEHGLWTHAHAVFNAACAAAYHDGTGEPGFITVDKLTWSDDGTDILMDGNFAESSRYKLEVETLELTAALAKAWAGCRYKVITNPCGEIVLSALGGYCVIADVVPYHAGMKIPGMIYDQSVASNDTRWDADAEDAYRTATRALIRTNLMDCLYGKEVKRTNRIGVGITGLHEYAWARFGFGWKDLVNEAVSMKFWLMMARFKRAVQDESASYSALLGVVAPHTDTTIKPAGCASLDTEVKTVDGGRSMLEIFQMNGFTLDEVLKIEAGTWIEPKLAISVLDESDTPKNITKLYVNGLKPVFEIEFEDGFVAKLTGNHKLKTATGWKRVDELTEDDEIVDF